MKPPNRDEDGYARVALPGAPEPPLSQDAVDIVNRYHTPPPSRTKHGKAIIVVAPSSFQGLEVGLSPRMGGIATKVVRSTI